MDKKTDDTATLLIAKDHLAPLIGRLGLVQNELSGLFDMPPASAETAAAADAWWQGRSEEQQHLYRGALAALASPLLIADVGIITRNERMISTHAVLPSLRWNDPAYLFAGEENGTRFRLEYLRQADLFTNTLLLHLQGAAPVYEMALKFTIPVRDFAVLLAAADLRQRLRYKALLDHAVFPVAFRSDAVAAAVTESFTLPDPRWLLPFCLPVLHLRSSDAAPESSIQSLDRLVTTGLLTKDKGTISFTEPGERFAESAAGRSGCVRIETYGVDKAGSHGRQSIILIRGEYFLWYAGVSATDPGMMVVTTIGLDQAEALLKELFTPLAEPRPVEPGRPVTVPVPAPVPGPAPVQAPAAARSSRQPKGATPAQSRAPVVTPAAAMVCKACGNPLKPGEKFCSKCLVKVPDAPAPAVVQAPAQSYQPPPPQQVPAPSPAPAGSPAPVCKACGNPLKPGEKFCSKCLVKVPDVPAPAPAYPSPPQSSPETGPAAPAAGTQVCQACGKPLRPGLKYCSNCGAKIP